MTVDCTTATTRRINTAVTVTPATAEVHVHRVATSDEMWGVSAGKIHFCYKKHWIKGYVMLSTLMTHSLAHCCNVLVPIVIMAAIIACSTSSTTCTASDDECGGRLGTKVSIVF